MMISIKQDRKVELIVFFEKGLEGNMFDGQCKLDVERCVFHAVACQCIGFCVVPSSPV